MENTKFQPAFENTGDPANSYEATPHLPGQLGITVEVGNKKWMAVQLDSGCVAAAASGAVTQYDLAFWKDRSTFLVTNALDQAELGRSGVAGVFMGATATYATPGGFCFIQRGGLAKVQQDNGTAAAGTWGSAYSGAAAGCDFRTVGATAAVYPEFCVAKGANSSGVTVELTLDPIR